MVTDRRRKPKRPIPFDFVIDILDQLRPHTKPMFGCTAVYVGNKIFFVLRDREDHTEDNGVWVATTPEFHKALQKEFPSLRSLKMFGPGPTGWQVLPSSSSNFEESVQKICELVLKSDPRIGKLPKIKMHKNISKKPKKVRSGK